MNLNRSIQRLGWGAVIALVALRLGIGWHFYKEGAKKFRDGFSATGFLAAATGPFAEMHKAMLRDRWGFNRLDYEKTVQFWTDYKQDVASELGFDQEQTEQANQVLEVYKKRMRTFLNENREEIDQYVLEVQRLQEAKQQELSEVAFQKQRLMEKEWELRQTVAPWLAGIATYGKQLENDLHAIAEPSQLATRVPIPDRSRSIAETLAKYVVIGVGILLILGLFTRIACLAGIGFLLTVMSTQPPWVETANTEYFYYQMVEVLGFVVLFAFAAGRYGGLDYIIHGLMQRNAVAKTK